MGIKNHSIYREESIAASEENYVRKHQGDELIYTESAPFIQYFPKYIRDYIANMFQASDNNETFELGSHSQLDSY